MFLRYTTEDENVGQVANLSYDYYFQRRYLMNIKQERGQAIVLVALALVALIAAVGLAIDGGRVYQTRREAQNAADSSALAGARLLLGGEACMDGSYSPSEAQIWNAIQTFAAENGVVWNGLSHPDSNILADYVTVDGNGDTVVLGSLGGGVPANTQGISVTVFLTRTPGFVQVVGVNELSAQGHAVAVVGPIVQMAAGGNILPIAVPDELLYQLGSGDDIYVENNAICSGEGADQQCVGDFEGGPQSQRGYLNFGFIYNIQHYQQSDPLRRTHELSLNANDLKAVIEVAAGVTPNNPPWWLGTPPRIPPIFVGTPPTPWPDYDGNSEYYIDGDFINGGTGQIQAAMGTLFDEFAGLTAYLPVFDKVYLVNYFLDNTGVFPTPFVEDASGPWPNPNSANNYLYHIIGFVAVEFPDPPPHPTPKDVEATLIRVMVGEGQIDPTQPIRCDARLYAVTLWE